MDDLQIRPAGQPDLPGEILGSTTVRILECRTAEVAADKRYTVRSPFTRFIYHRSGNANYRIGNRTHRMRGGTLLLIPADTTAHCKPDAGVKQYFTYCRIEFEGSVDLFKIWQPQAYALHCPPARAVFRRAIAGFRGSSIAGRWAAHTAVCELASWFLKDTKGRPSNSHLRDLQRLQPALRRIQQHLDRTLSLDELAETVHLSPKYFCNLFSERFGMGPMRFAARRKIQRAKQLLIATPLSIKEIAAQVGMRDPLYFSRLFRQEEGLSPRAYRNLWETLAD